MTTAQIVQLPNALAERVIQTKKCGRNPKSVLSFREARWERTCVELEQQEIAEEIERVKFQLVMSERMDTAWRERLARLIQRNMSPIERKKLVAEIRYDLLTWQEKETIRAAQSKP